MPEQSCQMSVSLTKISAVSLTNQVLHSSSSRTQVRPDGSETCMYRRTGADRKPVIAVVIAPYRSESKENRLHVKRISKRRRG